MLSRSGCLAILLFPILELVLLVQLVRWIGAGPTVAIVLGTALAGMILMRNRGVAALARAREDVAAGRISMGDAQADLIDAPTKTMAGLFLLSPGILSGLLGLLLLLPPSRRVLQRWMLNRLAAGIRSGSVHVTMMGGTSAPGPFAPGRATDAGGRDHGSGRAFPDDDDPPPRPGEIIQR